MKIRVYYEDTDCAQVVYYANYLKYMERSRTEFMRERGLDITEFQKLGCHFVVVEVNAKYRAPARYNDLLDVHTTIGGHSSASITFVTTISNESGKLLVKGEVKAAFIGSDGHAEKIPKKVLEALC